MAFEGYNTTTIPASTFSVHDPYFILVREHTLHTNRLVLQQQRCLIVVSVLPNSYSPGHQGLFVPDDAPLPLIESLVLRTNDSIMGIY